MEDKKNQQELNLEEELSEDDLDQVTGGAGLRQTVKVKTVDISDDVKSRI